MANNNPISKPYLHFSPVLNYLKSFFAISSQLMFLAIGIKS